MPDLTLKNNKVGGLYLIAEIFVTFVLASIVKTLQPDFSVFLILFFRYVFCLPLLIAYANATPQRRDTAAPRRRDAGATPPWRDAAMPRRHGATTP